MTTDYLALPESHTALHLARLWFVVALDRDMPRERALDFALSTATEYLAGACRDTQAKFEAAEWIRRDLEGIYPTKNAPLSRPGPIDRRG